MDCCSEYYSYPQTPLTYSQIQPKSSMEKHGILPVPAVFAVDRDGAIAFTYVNPDYKVRLPADELLEAAKTIAATD